MRTRLLLGAAGVLLGLFGVFRLVTEIPNSDLVMLVVWLVAAVAIHDGVLSPIVVGLGVALAKFVPARARRYLQAALIAGAVITVVAIPMIHREDSQPSSKGILQQDFTANLSVLLGIVAAVSLALYAIRVARDRPAQRPSATNVRSPEDQISSTE